MKNESILEKLVFNSLETHFPKTRKVVKIILQNVLQVSMHRITRIIKEPDCVTNLELIGISKIVKIHPHILLSEHGIGTTGISDSMKEVYETFYNTVIELKRLKGEEEVIAA